MMYSNLCLSFCETVPLIKDYERDIDDQVLLLSLSSTGQSATIKPSTFSWLLHGWWVSVDFVFLLGIFPCQLKLAELF